MSHYNFVIPYRNRANCLNILLKELPAYLATQSYISSYAILVVEQTFEKPFNLCKIINVGYDLAKKHCTKDKDSDRFIYHPVDGIPLEGTYEVPDDSAVLFCELGTSANKEMQNPVPKAFGFTNAVFEKINGLSNEYWGWGREDSDLQLRLLASGAPTHGTYIQFEFFMDHVGEVKKRNIDPYDVDFTHLEESTATLNAMKLHMDPFKSGLNTLNYTLLESVVVSEVPRIYHYKVTI